MVVGGGHGSLGEVWNGSRMVLGWLWGCSGSVLVKFWAGSAGDLGYSAGVALGVVLMEF